MRTAGRVLSSLALLFSLLITAGAPSHADSLSAVSAPVISLQKTGSTFTLTPAVWSAATKSTISWLVNGKVVASATKKTFTAPNKKGTNVQARETAGGVISNSNKITVGSVAINGSVKIAFADSAQKTLTSTAPKTFPAKTVATYQWFQGPFEIKGAHAPTYALATGDQGADISLQISYAAKGFASANSMSNSIPIAVAPREYKLTWSEEFNVGSPLNPKVWKAENGDGTEYNNRGWGNKERQYYLDTTASIDSSGSLVMNATRAGADAYKCYYGTQCEWLSSKFVTKGLIGFKYGRVEVKLKGPVGAGTWAAFWMLGANIDDRPWPGCGEIDITELLGRDPSTVYGTPHGPASGDSYTTTLSNGFASEYHTYAVDWLPDQITWYLDGKAYGSYNKATLGDPSHTWVFDHEYYLLANLAMGGGFGGAIDPALKDATTSIDYVHFSTINGIGEVINH
jgi:beta-glucanase (GH16 family)